MAITVRRRHLTASFYIAGALWFAVATGVLSSDVLSRREQCNALIDIFAPNGQDWMRMDSYNERFGVCAVSKHPVRGYMISVPIFPNPFLSATFLAVPIIGLFGFRMLQRRPRGLRRQKA
jgi:hypothetical protein